MHMALFGRSTARASATQTPPEVVPEPVTRAPLPRDVDGYRAYLLSQVRSLRPFGIGLREACGLTLCESITSDLDLPVFTAADVDGWAVRASNLVGASPMHPIVLPVVGVSSVGDSLGMALSAGTTVRVEEFAPVPEGADAVVPLTAAAANAEAVQFTGEVAFHDNLRPAGSRVADGDPLLRAGTVLDPRMIAMLAEVGLDKVLARPRPRVVIGTIGTDLTDAGLPLTHPTQMYDAATPMLAAAAHGDGAETFAIGVLPHDKVTLGRALSEQLVRADLVLLAADVTQELVDVLNSLGTAEACQVDMMPGGTLMFGFIGSERIPVLVLPSHVIAAYVAYEIFGRAVLRTLAGATPEDRDVTKQATSEALPYEAERTQFILAVHGTRGVAPIPLPSDAGGVELAYANALIVVPAGSRVAAGDTVDCWLLS